MKNLTVILYFLISNLIFSNKIDKLKTTEDVTKFVKEVYPEYGVIKYKNFDYGIFYIQNIDTIYNNLKCKDIFNVSEIKNWEKIDINNDGLTDLIFISHYFGYVQNIIIDKGKNKFKLIRGINNFNECEYIKPIIVKHKNQLRIRRVNFPFDRFDNEIDKYVKIDTLTYKYDSFIELNDKVIIDNKISSIEYRTNLCFGICPVYKLTINKNGLTEFEGIEQIQYIGKFTKNINKKKVEEIFEILNYIEIKKMNDYYDVNYTDAPTVYLKITFEDGSFKNIKDYGLSGTNGLSILYYKLSKIAIDTEWK